MLADDNDDDDGIIVVAVAINEAGSYSERKAGKGCCHVSRSIHAPRIYNGIFLVQHFIRL